MTTPPAGPPPGYPPAPGYGYAPVPDHPRAVTSLILGILGVVLCQVVAPFAWVISKRALSEIDAQPGRWGGRGQVQAGYVLGIVGTVLLGLGVLYFVFVFVVIGASFLGSANS